MKAEMATKRKQVDLTVTLGDTAPSPAMSLLFSVVGKTDVMMLRLVSQNKCEKQVFIISTKLLLSSTIEA
jgi:hypothetical protein